MGDFIYLFDIWFGINMLLDYLIGKWLVMYLDWILSEDFLERNRILSNVFLKEFGVVENFYFFRLLDCRNLVYGWV